MGTKADFYIERRGKLIWCGSTPYDGHAPDNKKEWFIKTAFAPQSNRMMQCRTEAEYIYTMATIWKRSQFVHPSDGWPWPWDDSQTTGNFFVFRKRKVEYYNTYSDAWKANPISLPNMSKFRNLRSEFGPVYLQAGK